ncbi:MAG: DMT family transporter [Pseudomonadota bacterium]
MTTNWRLGFGCALITAVFWGLLPFALKELLAHLDAITITWFRFSAAALIAALWYGRRSVSAIKRLLSPANLPLTILTVAALLINYVLFVYGLSFITPPAAEIIINTSPLLLLLGSILFFKEAFSPKQWFGVLLFSIGMLLFFHHRLRDLVSTEPDYIFGLAIVFLAGVLWACYGMGQKVILRKERANDLLLLIYVAGSLVYLPFTSPLGIIEFDGLLWAILLFASLNTIIAYGSFGIAMSNWDASRVSAVITVAPLITLGFGWFMNAVWPGSVHVEPLDALNWLGGLLVVVGSSIAALSGGGTQANQKQST